jgi:hypothetical protein
MKCNLHLIYDDKRKKFKCIHHDISKLETNSWDNLQIIAKTEFSPLSTLTMVKDKTNEM